MANHCSTLSLPLQSNKIMQKHGKASFVTATPIAPCHRQSTGLQFLLSKPVLPKPAVISGVCYAYCSQATREFSSQSSTAAAPECRHLKAHLASHGFCNHTKGGWRDLCPPPAPLREVIQRHRPTLRAQFLPAQKQGPKPCKQDACNERLCPAMTNGPAEIVCHRP